MPPSKPPVSSSPLPTPPTASAIARAVVDGLQKAIARNELEQAPHGLDSWSELALHAVLAQAFVDAGCFVAREQRYPRDRKARARTSGRRCDLVVTQGGPLLLEHVQPDLFSPTPRSPAQAAWIEVKVLKQHGLGGRGNVGWQRSLLAPPTADLRKLADDESLGLRVLVMVLFTASAEVSAHDFGVWLEAVESRGLVVRAEPLEHLPIVDRRNNRLCSVAVVVVGASSAAR
jgi:hypothetical protein